MLKIVKIAKRLERKIEKKRMLKLADKSSVYRELINVYKIIEEIYKKALSFQTSVVSRELKDKIVNNYLQASEVANKFYYQGGGRSDIEKLMRAAMILSDDVLPKLKKPIFQTLKRRLDTALRTYEFALEEKEVTSPVMRRQPSGSQVSPEASSGQGGVVEFGEITYEERPKRRQQMVYRDPEELPKPDIVFPGNVAIPALHRRNVTSPFQY